MILNNAPQNEAIVSNVGEIGEFRIRNSAKAFNILSSGLYANKIRAIIRELSCNAVDSHAAAGKKDVPFELHLPNQLEPHFSIRDFGTGLSHEQVQNIYTTYFESTKTNSNDYIGALGLGSKSPFSYTDNFTVTAIQGGRKGIYSAFINADGVPSIALMMEEQTDEPAGVEVKFSVNDYYDFNKFQNEARNLFAFFTLRPVITGVDRFEFREIEYESRDIIPGVHQLKGGRGQSMAVMGNIGYPIDIPQSERASANNDIYSMLNCGLELHFAIGELDFQASREGLSYIPQTIAAIKAKLEAVSAVLAVKIAEEADAIPNLWDRAIFLASRKDNQLWSVAVASYAKDSQLPTWDATRYGGLKMFKLGLEDLTKKYNIQLRPFERNRGNKTCVNHKHRTDYSDKRNANGHYDTWFYWDIEVDKNSHFVVNDLKTGAGERAKHHYRETTMDVHSRTIWVIEPVDRTKPMKTKAFFKAILNPPEDRIVNASTLMERPRASGMGKNVTILKLERRGGSGYRRSDDDMVWRDAGKADSFTDTEIYYYIPLSGFTMLSAKGYSRGIDIYSDVKSLPDLFKGQIYGVRKSDIEEIKKRPNWKNFEDHISSVLNGKDNSKVMMSLVRASLDNTDFFNYNNESILKMIDGNSPYAMLVKDFINVEKFNSSRHNVDRLFRNFAPTANVSPEALINKYNAMAKEVIRKYPLLKALSTYRVEAGDIAEYINLIDTKKEGI